MKAIILFTSLHIFAMTLVSVLSIAPVASPIPSQRLLIQVRQAMATTTQSNTNITQAYEACELWNRIMSASDELPENIRGICYALQASCRSRVGQDTLALESYQACLKLRQYIPKDTLVDAQMGKAYALQRLMKYNDAYSVFLQCDTERACLGAVTCLLRLCNIDQAEKVLRNFCEAHPDSKEVQGILGVLLFTQATTQNDMNEAMRLLGESCNVAPLLQWAHRMALLQNQDSSSASSKRIFFDFLDVASVNQSPFDDPLLMYLDDKVLLHDLLTENKTDTCAYWPKGFVLPRDSSILKECLLNSRSDDVDGRKEWILKQRAGYGSHGNRLVSEKEVLDLLDKPPSDGSDSFLCQRLVSAPLLLKGYKFSMRIYVVYFQGGTKQASPQVYLATEGLVKVASVPYHKDTADDERVHMTNSGRESEMGQYNLAALESEFEEAGWSYNDLWDDIRQCVRHVMRTYLTFAQEQHYTGHSYAVGKLGIPKILGIDFIVNASRHPFLLEVNRFPGLEPRDSSDYTVKQSVVQGAWNLAASRVGLDTKDQSHRLVDLDTKPCSFEQLL